MLDGAPPLKSSCRENVKKMCTLLDQENVRSPFSLNRVNAERIDVARRSRGAYLADWLTEKPTQCCDV